MAKARNGASQKDVPPAPVAGRAAANPKGRRASTRTASRKARTKLPGEGEEGQMEEDNAHMPFMPSTQERELVVEVEARDKGKGKAKAGEDDAVANAPVVDGPLPEPSTTSAWVPRDDDDDEVMLLQTGEEDLPTAQTGASALPPAAAPTPRVHEATPIRQRSSSPLAPRPDRTHSPAARPPLDRLPSPLADPKQGPLELGAPPRSLSPKEPAQSPTLAEAGAPLVPTAPPTPASPPGPAPPAEEVATPGPARTPPPAASPAPPAPAFASAAPRSPSPRPPTDAPPPLPPGPPPPLPPDPPPAAVPMTVDPSPAPSRPSAPKPPGQRMFETAMSVSQRIAPGAQSSRPLASRITGRPSKLVAGLDADKGASGSEAEQSQAKGLTIKGAAANGRKASPAAPSHPLAGLAAAATATRQSITTSSKSPSPPRPPQPPLPPTRKRRSSGDAPPVEYSKEDMMAHEELVALGKQDAAAATFRKVDSSPMLPHLSKRDREGDRESPGRSKRSRTASHQDRDGEDRKGRTYSRRSPARQQDEEPQGGNFNGAATHRGVDPRAGDPAFTTSYEDDVGPDSDYRRRDERGHHRSDGYRNGRSESRHHEHDRRGDGRHRHDDGGRHLDERRRDYDEPRWVHGGNRYTGSYGHPQWDLDQGRAQPHRRDSYDRRRSSNLPDNRGEGRRDRKTPPPISSRDWSPPRLDVQTAPMQKGPPSRPRNSYRPDDEQGRSVAGSPALLSSNRQDREDRGFRSSDTGEPPLKKTRWDQGDWVLPPTEPAQMRRSDGTVPDGPQAREDGAAVPPPAQHPVEKGGSEGWGPAPGEESEKEPGEVEEGEIDEPTPPMPFQPPKRDEIRIALPSVGRDTSSYLPHPSVFQPDPPAEPPPPPPPPRRTFDYDKIDMFGIRPRPLYHADNGIGFDEHAGMVPGPIPDSVVKSNDRVFTGESPIGHYELLYKLGEGTFGEVVKGVYWGAAFDKGRTKVAEAKPRPGMRVKAGDEVAIKRIITHKESDGMPITSLREIRLLRALDHPNVVPVVDMAHALGDEKAYQRGYTYMIFPYLQHDLAGVISNPKIKLTVGHIKLFARQLLLGLSYLHGNGILHRDMKTANLLVSNKGQLKIADFGLARPVEPMKDRVKYTACVVTRWYRPPEILLGERRYNVPVDMWGVGCVIAEMFHKQPILAGESDVHQCKLIFQLCGHPTSDSMPGWDSLEGCDGVKSWGFYPRAVFARFKRFGDDRLVELLDELLLLDPTKRLTALQALDHKWFWSGPPAAEEVELNWADSHEYDGRKAAELARKGHDKQLLNFITVPAPQPRGIPPQSHPMPMQGLAHPQQSGPPGHPRPLPPPPQVPAFALGHQYYGPPQDPSQHPPYHQPHHPPVPGPPMRDNRGPLATRPRAGVQVAAAPMPGQAQAGGPIHLLPPRPNMGPMAAAPMPGRRMMAPQVPMPGGGAIAGGTSSGPRHHNGSQPPGPRPPPPRPPPPKGPRGGSYPSLNYS